MAYCTLHPSWRDSVGVCAFCLRERLLSLIEASRSQAGQYRRKSDHDPPPIIFPRSVSPYVRRGSSHRHQLFFATPQIGPATFEEEEEEKKKKKKKGRRSGLSLLASLFGAAPRSAEIDKDPAASTAQFASPSWFAACRKKKSGLFSLDEDTERENEFWCEWSPGCRKSVSGKSVAAPIPRGSRHGQNVSGSCWSPLVRASPKRNEAGLWLDLRSGNRQHLASAGAPSANRSRKILDFGRYP